MGYQTLAECGGLHTSCEMCSLFFSISAGACIAMCRLKVCVVVKTDSQVQQVQLEAIQLH